MFFPRQCNGTRESHENLKIFKVCFSPRRCNGTWESHENLKIFKECFSLANVMVRGSHMKTLKYLRQNNYKSSYQFMSADT